MPFWGGMIVKIVVIIAVLAMLMSGCKQHTNMETVADELIVQQPAEQMMPVYHLPAEAVQQTIESDSGGQVYFCDGYTLTVQTVPSGDLHKTIYNTTGFSPDQLEILETQKGSSTRYTFVWTAASENGDEVGRCVILDDGNYHYVLTVMADAENAGKLSGDVWKEICSSFRLMDPEEVVSSGS